MSVPTIHDAKATIMDKKNIIGEGSARTVYWDGVSYWVYKVGHSQWGDGASSNVNEFENWLAIKGNELPTGVLIPEMRMLADGILAVQYINGEHPKTSCWGFQHDCKNVADCWYTLFETSGIERRRGFGDISYANVILTDDGMYVIDLEF